MQSAGMRYNNLSQNGKPEDPSTWETYYESLAKAGITLSSIADKIVYTQSPRTINDTVPTDWGAATSKAGSDKDVANRDPSCPVYFEGGGDVVYSLEQKRNWDNGTCI